MPNDPNESLSKQRRELIELFDESVTFFHKKKPSSESCFVKNKCE
jgi:hypothetical protein